MAKRFGEHSGSGGYLGPATVRVNHPGKTVDISAFAKATGWPPGMGLAIRIRTDFAARGRAPSEMLHAAVLPGNSVGSGQTALPCATIFPSPSSASASAGHA